MKNSGITNVNALSIKPVRIGPEGYVTTLAISADGLRKVVGCDVRPPYIKDSTDTEWRPLLTTANMPTSLYDPPSSNSPSGLSNANGTYSAIIAPSNKDIIFVAWDALILRTSTAGVGANSWTALGLAPKKMLSNSGEPRLWNNKMAVHPTDPNTLLVGTMVDGVYYTTNANLGASSTFTQISGITAGDAMGNGDLSIHLVAIDPGNANYVYITKHGTGVYRSTTGVSGTFSLIGGTNMPTSIRQLEVCSDGTVWICGYSNQYLSKIARGTGNTWTRYGQTQHGLSLTQGMGVDPTNSAKIYVNDGDNYINYSIDGGTTWARNDGQPAWSSVTTLSNYPYQNYTDVPFGENFKGLKGGAKSLVDAAGKMYTVHGTGVNWFDTVSMPVGGDSGTPLNFYDESKGIEELGLRKILSIPGNSRPLFCTLDKGLLRPKDVDRFTCRPIFIDPALPESSVDHAYDLDYATGDPTYVVCPMKYNNEQSGRSKDGGKTWVKWPTAPLGAPTGGSICSTGYGKAIVIPVGKAVYTLDDGTSWNYLNLPGAGSSGQTGWSNNIFFQRYQVAADHERTGYAVVVTSNAANGFTSDAAAWLTSDHGVTWTKKFNGVIDPTGDPDQYYQCTIDYIPGHAGELLYCSGPSTFVNGYLKKSSDDALNWSSVRPTEIRDVWCFAFGPTATGATYPLIFIFAKVNGVRGLYYSQDFFATTPVLISRFPDGNIAPVVHIEGDKNIWGRCYIAFDGGGAAYVDLLDKMSGT